MLLPSLSGIAQPRFRFALSFFVGQGRCWWCSLFCTVLDIVKVQFVTMMCRVLLSSLWSVEGTITLSMLLGVGLVS